MNRAQLILTAITIAINVVPIAGVLVMNQNNLLGLVVPPEIDTVINNLSTPEAQLGESFGNITIADSYYDSTTRTMTLTLEVTNPLQFDLAVDSMSANVRCDEHDFPLGHATIANPASINTGKTAEIGIVGTWTQDAIRHLLTSHAGAQKADVELIGISLTVNGIRIQTDEVLKIPDFPIT